MTSHPRWQHVGGSAAEVYERHLVPAMFAPWAPTLLDLAAIRAGERILDVACGTGVVARLAAARAGNGGQVTGLDINGAMLAVARSLPPADGAPIAWVEASALAMPFPDGTFDAVLCQQGLQQFPDRPAALGEMRRALVPGGRLALSVWSALDGSPGMAALVAALARHVGIEAANNRRAPFALGDPGQVTDLLVAAGFTDLQLHTLVKHARFSSPEGFVAAQLAATPLSTLGAIPEETRQAIARDVRGALGAYLDGDRLDLPMQAHIAFARA
jgi:SAM-dependent methyltransferase